MKNLKLWLTSACLVLFSCNVGEMGYTDTQAAPGCDADADCAVGLVCNLKTSACETPATQCSPVIPCRPSELCQDGVCVLKDPAGTGGAGSEGGAENGGAGNTGNVENGGAGNTGNVENGGAGNTGNVAGSGNTGNDGNGGSDPGVGGSDPGVGGSSPADGGSDQGVGGQPPATGGTPSATGGSSSATGGSATTTPGGQAATGGASSATGGNSAAAGNSSTGGANTATGGSGSSVGGNSGTGGATNPPDCDDDHACPNKLVCDEGKCVPEDDCGEQKAACLDECADGKACALAKCQNACEKEYAKCSDSGKLTVCHFPPGNLDNPIEIKIPLSAFWAHIANHGNAKHGDGSVLDYVGTCQPLCNDWCVLYSCATERTCIWSTWRGQSPSKKD